MRRLALPLLLLLLLLLLAAAGVRALEYAPEYQFQTFRPINRKSREVRGACCLLACLFGASLRARLFAKAGEPAQNPGLLIVFPAGVSL
jgi:hypothetical protein